VLYESAKDFSATEIFDSNVGLEGLGSKKLFCQLTPNLKHEWFSLIKDFFTPE
jgi:hypothetical protein